MFKKAIAILTAVTMFPVSCFAGGGIEKYEVNLIQKDPIIVPSEIIYSLRQLDDSPVTENSKLDFNHDGEMDVSYMIKKNETSVLQRLSGADKLTQDYAYHFIGRKYSDISFKLCQPVTGITLNLKTLNMVVGSSCPLTATVKPETAVNKSVIWTSSNESVATVKDGLVKAISSGKAVITATTISGGLSASCKIGVHEKEEPVLIIPTKIESKTKKTMVTNPVFTCILKDSSGNVLPKQNVQIKVNGKKYTKKTNEKGIAKIHFKAKTGIYNVFTNYSGNSKYKPYKKTFKISVVHSIKVYAPTIKQNANKAIIKAVVKVNGEVQKRKTVKITFMNKSYWVKTNNKGIAKVTITKSIIKKLKVGRQYLVKAVYSNDEATAYAKVVE